MYDNKKKKMLKSMSGSLSNKKWFRCTEHHNQTDGTRYFLRYGLFYKATGKTFPFIDFNRIIWPTVRTTIIIKTQKDS